jgi:hypothetical protein
MCGDWTSGTNRENAGALRERLVDVVTLTSVEALSAVGALLDWSCSIAW